MKTTESKRRVLRGDAEGGFTSHPLSTLALLDDLEAARGAVEDAYREGWGDCEREVGEYETGWTDLDNGWKASDAHKALTPAPQPAPDVLRELVEACEMSRGHTMSCICAACERRIDALIGARKALEAQS